MQWIRNCKCAENPPEWYPSRLIDLRNFKKTFLGLRPTNTVDDPELELDDEERTFSVIHTAEWKDGKPGHGNARYVTLSHCWGDEKHHGPKLTSQNLLKFQNGVRLKELPRTFRDAIKLAARLPYVGYLWIDSLCIKQGVDETEDWLAESAVMNKVYSCAFLNISATAAEHSDGGLYFPREPELLLEDEISLNIDGVPGAWTISRAVSTEEDSNTLLAASKSRSPSLFSWFQKLTVFKFLWHLFTQFPTLLRYGGFQKRFLSTKQISKVLDEKQKKIRTAKEGDLKHLPRRPVSGDDPRNLHRCIILDTSFWANHVDQAPVNTRAWVLQERLLCPRVLHFCYDQIAWECSEFDAAESRPDGMPNFQFSRDGLIKDSRIKGLDPQIDGKLLREGRLKGYSDPVPHLAPKIYAFELWRRIIELYSRTGLTNHQDKLIAISGIAKLMATKIGSEDKPATYIAGLWKDHLVSQLLWRVEPVFNEKDKSFDYPTSRSDTYRAPSFSWASLDSAGNGISYGEITDQNIFVDVEEVQVKPKKEGDPFGMITGGHIVLWGKLRKIRMWAEDKGRFCWQLLDRAGLEDEIHMNVYIDCVGDVSLTKKDGITERNDLFCLPVAKGGSIGSGDLDYLLCILLQLQHQDGRAVYRRIGFSKLSTWEDKLTHEKILEVEDSDVDFPHQGYDYATGRHRIVIF
jgi:hypothetical protein